VLPILHLNGYKIANPTVLARIPHEELESFFRGCGWEPHFVEGRDPEQMHRLMADTLDECIESILLAQKAAREEGCKDRPRWPMIVLRTPKGWTGPDYVDGAKVEGYWRAHQVPIQPDTAEHIRQIQESVSLIRVPGCDLEVRRPGKNDADPVDAGNSGEHVSSLGRGRAHNRDVLNAVVLISKALM
jgi:phosphoketolase